VLRYAKVMWVPEVVMMFGFAVRCKAEMLLWKIDFDNTVWIRTV
jgi:hypothetical protein